MDVKPEHEMKKVLYAVDELTGLIGAVVLMRPSKSVQDLLLAAPAKLLSRSYSVICKPSFVALSPSIWKEFNTGFSRSCSERIR